MDSVAGCFQPHSMLWLACLSLYMFFLPSFPPSLPPSLSPSLHPSLPPSLLPLLSLSPLPSIPSSFVFSATSILLNLLPLFSGEMILRTASLNAQICSAVAKHTPPLRSPSSPQNPFGSFNYLQSLRAEEYKSLMQLLDTVENGSPSSHINLYFSFSLFLLIYAFFPLLSLYLSLYLSISLFLLIYAFFPLLSLYPPGEGETQLLSSTASQVRRMNNSVHKLAFDVLFSELKQKLAEVPTLKVYKFMHIFSIATMSLSYNNEVCGWFNMIFFLST